MQTKTEARAKKAMRCDRGSISIELTAVVAMLLAALTMTLDIYAYQRAQAGTLRLATLVAEYIAHQDAGAEHSEIRALISATRAAEVGTSDHGLTARLTALHQADEDSPTKIGWVEHVKFKGGEGNRWNEENMDCPLPEDRDKFRWFGDEGTDGDTLADASMPEEPNDSLNGEADVIVVQLCVTLTNPGIAQNALFDHIIYRIAARPFDAPDTRPPAKPTRES